MQIYTGSIRQAEQVLKALRVLLKQVTPRKGCVRAQPLSLGMYSNGREQGYTLTLWQGDGRSVRWLFSENRNSDDTVVYFGTGLMEGLTEEEWKTKAFFKSPQEAAKAIASHIKELVR